MTVFSVSLRSGSSGNATFIRTESAGITVDCGMSGRQFELALEAIGEAPHRVDAILLTHEHIDHSSGIGVVMRRHRIPLYLTEKTYLAARADLGSVQESLIHLIEAGRPFTVRDTVIHPFSTPHDAVDPLGFRIETARGAIGIATDLGHFSPLVRQGLTGCRVVHLESNFDPALLEAGSYPPALKRRIASSMGHLSNEEAGRAASWLIRQGTEVLALSHLSEENNLPELALRVVSTYLSHTGAKAGQDYHLSVSARYNCSRPHYCGAPPPAGNPASCPGGQLSLFSQETAGGQGGPR